MTEYKNWPVPHNAKLERPMEPGQLVALKGKFFDINLKEDKEADPRVMINLSTSGNGGNADNIPLHISIRFKHNTFVLNTKKNGEWGKEVVKKNPFDLGKNMDLRVRAHGDKFEITVDGKDFLTYDHRLPLGSVDHVFVDGPIALHGVNWGGKYYSVPYETGIQGGFGTGKRLIVSGVPEKKDASFYINLVHANGDIAIHFNPRFKEKAVVRNSKAGGEWQNEEREGDMPFKAEHVFDLVIQNESYSFQVYVNDERFCTYAHRMDPNSVVGVQVSGDVELQSIIVV